MNNSSSRSDLPYCGTLVKDFDFDRFMLSLFLPANVREDVWAVLAFNHEISKTREVVSESTLGLIRLQWWRDQIAAIYACDFISEHEVLKPLARAITRHDLPRDAFDQLVYAREFDLEDVRPGNLEGLMNYADFTTTPLFSMIVKISGDNPEAHIIQPVAVNYALSGILRATKSFAKQHRFYLPEDMMQHYNITCDGFWEEEAQKALRRLVRDICDNRLPDVKPDHIFLKGAEVLSDIYFRQIKSCDYDVMASCIEAEPPFKAFRMFLRTKIL